jgi:hypothetical protein
MTTKQVIRHLFVLLGMIIGFSLAADQTDGSVADCLRNIAHASFGYATFGVYRMMGWI